MDIRYNNNVNVLKKIQKYGLNWDLVSVQENKYYNMQKEGILKQQFGITFAGILRLHPIYGPYMDVRSVIDKDKERYSILVPQYFFAEELEEFIDKHLQWYHKLRDGYVFSKSALKPQEDKYHMSFTVLTGSVSDGRSMAVLFHQLDYGKSVYVENYRKRPFLFVDKNTYEQLPNKWTIYDLYNMHKEHYDEQKQFREALWYNIAKARVEHKPVKIPVVYNNYSLIQTYSERTTPYGVNFPMILMDEEKQKRRDEINRKYAKDSQRER